SATTPYRARAAYTSSQREGPGRPAYAEAWTRCPAPAPRDSPTARAPATATGARARRTSPAAARDPRSRRYLQRHFGDRGGVHVVDESADVVGVGDERALPDAPQRLLHAVLDFPERLDRPRRSQPGGFLDLVLERVLGDQRQTALGVLHHDDFPGLQFALADGQRPDHVVGRHPAGVAQNVRLAVPQAEHVEHLDPGIHAGHHGY